MDSARIDGATAFGIATINGPHEIEIGAIKAASFLSALPFLIAFVLMQRQIIAGLRPAALRG